jgi:hypothetical protein
MNEDLGVEREGSECRLRLSCLSQLTGELQAISEEEQPEIREKMMRLALKGVEDSFISRMSSPKQINILREDISLLLREYRETTAPPRHLKNRESRSAVRVLRTKEPKIPNFQTDENDAE